MLANRKPVRGPELRAGVNSSIHTIYLATTWKVPAAPSAAALGVIHTSNVPGGTTHLMFVSNEPRSCALTVKSTLLLSPGCSVTR